MRFKTQGPILISLTTLLAAVLFALEPTPGTTTISGTVKDDKGGGVQGVLVRLVNTDRRITTSVITGPGGRYFADSMPAGSYEVWAERKGFEAASRRAVTTAKPVSVDLVIKARGPHVAHITPADVYTQFPESPDKELVFDTCLRCHSMMDLALRRNDRAGWERIIGVMSGRRAGMTEGKKNRLVNYFATHFNSNRPVPPYLTEPEPPIEGSA